ncbi:MAG TPA: ATP-binding protein [Polyangiaceae bacterium]|nr:ATP-binding protein [Polyangiaceae bacterium]
MPKADQLKMLIESFAASDDARFYRTALQLAADEARRGHGKLAQELRDLIDNARRRGATVSTAVKRAIPLAQPRGDLGDLVLASYPDLTLSEMVLSEPLARSLARLLRENRGTEALREHGLRPRRKLLLVGPPGTGKTMTARAIAGELHLPLYRVRFESMITKFMGETAAKLKLVFDAMQSVKAVFLFDEFDAIGAQRALPNDTGEIRRILNSFLKFIEADDSESVIIAATNHAELLDRALIRRFDDILTYSTPGPPQVLATLQRSLGPFATKLKNWSGVASDAEGLSYADIVRACDDAAKDMVLEGRKSLAEADISHALRERKQAHVALDAR